MLDKIKRILTKREFISVATSDFSGRPNAAPKFFLKLEHGFVYLVDYTIGRTWENLKSNPRVSLSLMDTDSLYGYQINGSVEIIDKGEEYHKIMNELLQKEIDLSVKRITEAVVSGKVHESFEVAIPKRIIVFKVKIEEVAEIGPRGELKREKLCEN